MNTRQHCDWSSALSTKSYKLQENEINNGALYYLFYFSVSLSWMSTIK